MTEVRESFDAVEGAILAGQRAGVEAACQFLLSKSDELVPHETGHLQSTGDYDIEDSGDGISGGVYYDTVYALRQHEDLTLNHDNGRTAKYLEKPAIQYGTQMGEIIGTEIKRRLE